MNDAGAGSEHCDVVVVGGGVAGLFAASTLRDHDVVVLESADRAGGRVASVRRGDYWVNTGAQFAAGEGPLAQAVERYRIPTGSLAGTRTGLAVGTRFVPSDRPERLVFRADLSLRGRLDLARLGLRIRRAYTRMAENRDPAAARRVRDALDNEPAARFSAGLRDPRALAIFDAFSRSWAGTEPAEMSAGQAALFIGGSFVSAAKIPNFSLPLGGNQSITDAVSAELGPRIRLGARVVSVTSGEDGVTVVYEQEGATRTLTAGYCVLAVPATKALEVLADPPEAYRRALAAVRYGTFVVVGFFTGEQGPQSWDDVWAMTVADRSFNIVLNPAAALRGGGPRAPGGALVAYAGGDSARRLLALEEREIADRFTRDLVAVLPATAGIIDEVVVARWPEAIPFWSPGERTSVRALRRPLGRLWFAGDYVGFPSMAGAAMAGETAAREILQDLAA